MQPQMQFMLQALPPAGPGITMVYSRGLAILRWVSICQLIVAVILTMSGISGLIMVVRFTYPMVLILAIGAGFPMLILSITSVRLCNNGRLVIYGIKTFKALKIQRIVFVITYILTVAGCLASITMLILQLRLKNCSKEVYNFEETITFFTCLDMPGALRYIITQLVFVAISLVLLLIQITRFVALRSSVQSVNQADHTRPGGFGRECHMLQSGGSIEETDQELINAGGQDPTFHNTADDVELINDVH